MTYNQAARKARRLLKENAGRAELLDAIEEALKLAPSSKTADLWRRMAQDLRGGREIRTKETA